MRKLVLIGVLALTLAGTSVAAASTPVTTWHADLAGPHIRGAVTVSITAAGGGSLTENLTGVAPRSLVMLWLRGGTCAATGFGVVRVRWTASRSGHLVATVPLTAAMTRFFTLDWKHRGGVSATATDGSLRSCAALVAGR